MNSLRHNGFQVVAACDFEDELPEFVDKNFELAYRIYPESVRSTPKKNGSVSPIHGHQIYRRYTI